MDNQLTLTYSMYSNKGVYALLLGSGVSYSSGIPTGWGIVLDLIRKIAKLQGEDCGANPDNWYREKYNKEPDYSDILNELTGTTGERQMILKQYFEPTDEELSEGIKTPTEAHKAIAKLVKKEYIKVIITTNFDKLMERALEEVGITPIVISNVDTLKGATPIVHSQCTIIKVHGDYMDSRIKNTVAELEEYEPEMNNLLDSVLDDFGIITCGWSAEWDIALRNCFIRSKNYRYSTYWTTIGEPTERANELISRRKANIIKIKGADDFFTNINDKIEALEELYRENPESIKVSVAILKKYIVRKENRIKLNDFILKEVNDICKKFNEEIFNTSEKPTNEDVSKRIKKYEAISEKMLHLLANGCYWGEEEFREIWKMSIELIGNTSNINQGGYSIFLDLRKYPALLMLYVAGIASVASGRFDNLYAITNEAKIKDVNSTKKIIESIYPGSVFEDKVFARDVLNKPNRHTPVSDYLFDTLRGVFKDLIPLDENYNYFFDYFEEFLAIIFLDTTKVEVENMRWCPVGRFSWKRQYKDKGIINEEYNKNKENWKALKVGYFNNDIKRYEDVNKKMDEFVKKVSDNYF